MKTENNNKKNTKEKKKTRLYGFLKRRGFGNDAIFPVMNELLSASEADLEIRELAAEERGCG